MKRCVFVCLVLFLAASVGFTVGSVLYSLEKSAVVYVPLSGGELQIYGESGCTGVVQQVDFGSVLKGSSRNSTMVYLKNQGVEAVAVSWRCVGLPAGFSVKAFFGASGSETVWNEWTGGIGLQPSTKCPVKFELSVSGGVVAGQSYGWTLVIESSN